MRHTIPGQRLVALCVLGWLLFNYPLLALAIERGTPPGSREPPSADALKD